MVTVPQPSLDEAASQDITMVLDALVGTLHILVCDCNVLLELLRGFDMQCSGSTPLCTTQATRRRREVRSG